MPESVTTAQVADWLNGLERRLSHLEDVVGPQQSSPDLNPQTTGVIESDIRAAYRLLLGREVDSEGLRTYLARAEDGISHADLVTELLSSDERATLVAQDIVEIDIGGVTVCVDKSEREFGRAISRDGVWEAHIVAQIQRLLTPGSVFVDVGANIGVMSFHAAKAVSPNGKVIAFEPNPDNVQRFLQGVIANKFDQLVRLIPLAASATSSVFAIKGGSNTYLAPAAAGMRLAASIPADDFLTSEARIDLIKIDIEGHEPLALNGLSKTLDRHRPTILCEFNPRCLKIAGNTDAEGFAAQIFTFASSVEIIEHDHSLTAVDAPSTLTRLWAERNAEHVERGDLPDGMVHFDLLIRFVAR
ncbi:MAG: hypothetical protein CVT77_01715 [Alphaproteobacteria bacterium HGW-Alphaproteobacteria-16]|nr:MAG: hypothetical protein CVT77_01715 [Alphaproteobacteria bacterium HGW-Alphaproteobacteria-16]